jgi:RNA polymerase sigma-70 factor (ECF subfamily)
MDKSEADLIFDILAGDANAYAVLVKRYQRPIYNLMFRFTFSEADAFDLTQETFVKAYERLEQFKPSGRFFPWLYAIGLNVARDQIRKAKRAKLMEEDLIHSVQNPRPDFPEEDSVARPLDFRRVEESMKQLSLESREAIFMRFHEGMTVNEIAKAMGVTGSAVKMKIHRGLIRLRELLAGEPVYEK